MITIENYKEKIKGIDIDAMPEVLRKGHEILLKYTKDATDFSVYHSKETLKSRLDLYLQKLNEYVQELKKHPEKDETNEETSEEADSTYEKRKSRSEKANIAAQKIVIDLIRKGYKKKDFNTKLELDFDDGYTKGRIWNGFVSITEYLGEDMLGATFPLDLIYADASAHLKRVEKENKQEDKQEAQKKRAETKAQKKAEAKADSERKKQVTKALIDKAKEIDRTVKEMHTEKVEKIDDDVKIIKRFAALHGKEKTEAQILTFTKSLQKAILEKRIRKTSKHAELIQYIQNFLVKKYNAMKECELIKIKPDILDKCKKVGGSQVVRPSIIFLKRFTSLHGTVIDRKKAERLLKDTESALTKKVIHLEDPYLEAVKSIVKSLKRYLKEDGKETLAIQEAELNGLMGILGCGCKKSLSGVLGCDCGKHLSGSLGCDCGKKLQGLSGFDVMSDTPRIMNSLDFVKIKFTKIPLDGKFGKLIPYLVPGARIAVWAEEKFGKSILCYEFAGYLSNRVGRGIYVLKEESLSPTSQEKVIKTGIANANLDVTNYLPEGLSGYKFIFLDSVNTLNLKPDELRELHRKYPELIIVYILQSTKSGNFKGGKEYVHDADQIVEFTEPYVAKSYGRLGQGDTVSFFNEKYLKNAGYGN